MTRRWLCWTLIVTIVLWSGSLSVQAQVVLRDTPLGPLVSTGGGGHYQFYPLITKDGDHTLVVASKGSRVQVFADGVPGPLVTNVPTTKLSPAFSADGKRSGYVASVDNGKSVVIVNGTQSPIYDSVPWFSFAPVGHHFAYLVQQRQGNSRSFIVDNGKAGLIYEQAGGDLATFSPDGEHLAYVAIAPVDPNSRGSIRPGPNDLRPQQWRVVVDGAEQPLHFLNISKPIFSQDSKHMAYLAGTNGFTMICAVVDGKQGPNYELVDKLVLSDDGSRVAYVATKPKQPNAIAPMNVVVDNGAEGQPYGAIQQLVVSHDGKRLAYVALNGSGQSVVIDNGKLGLQYMTCNNPQFTPDSSTLLYTAGTPSGQFMVADGQEIGPFTQVNGQIAFSEDGHHWACWVQPPAGGWAVVQDGKTIPLNPGVGPGTLEFQQGTGRLFMRASNASTGAPALAEIGAPAVQPSEVPSALVFSPNHQHTFRVSTANFGTSQVSEQIAIDGQPPLADKYMGVKKPAISDDGKHYAFIGARYGAAAGSLTHAIYDGKEGPSYNTIWDLALSPDGQHVAYIAQDGPGSTGNWYVVVDGMKGPPFQDVLAYTPFQEGDHRLIFAADGSLRFLAFFDGQLHRLSYAPGAFNGLPSMAAVEAEKPGLRELHKWSDAPGVTAIRFLFAPDGTIYGISAADGKFKKGSLFKMKNDGSDFTVLHDFFGGDADGENPLSLIVEPDGKLLGAAGAGKVFRYDPKSQQYGLVEITKRDYGPTLIAGISADGKIIGMGGGAGLGYPDLFSMAADGSGYATVNNSQFGNPPRQYEQIVQAKDGSFFAVSVAGGGPSLVKFKNLTEPPTVVHKFVNSPNDGGYPEATLAMDSKGNLYGTARNGGMSQEGVVYRVDADGSNYKVIYNPDKFDFTRVFAAGDDGKLYGIAKEGLLALPADGSAKSPEVVTAFDGTPHMSFRGTSNLFVHEGAVYGLSNKAIYKVPLSEPKSSPGAAAPSVATQTVQPQALGSDVISFTEPTGPAAPAGAPPSQQQAQPQQTQQQQSAQQQQQQQQQQQRGNRSSDPANRANDAVNRANNAANRLRGFLRGN